MHVLIRSTLMTLGLLAACSPEATVDENRSAMSPCAEPASLTLTHDGESISAFYLRSREKDEDRALIVLDGYPPDRDADYLGLGKAACERGWNSLFVHYRGTWQSGGQLDMDNLVEDALAAVDYLRDREMRRIAIVGHSLGGYVALMAGAREADVACVISVAGADHGILGRHLARSAEMRTMFHNALASSVGPDKPVHTMDVDAVVADIADRADEFDLQMQAAGLAPKKLLLIAAEQDEQAPRAVHHDPLVDALDRAGANDLVSEVIEADHNFTGLHAEVRAFVTGWLDSHCATNMQSDP